MISSHEPARSPAASSSPRVYPPAPTSFDRRTKQKLARGSIAIDARIDLHGFTQARAHAELLRFLKQAQNDGARMVLVITGKGGAPHSGPAEERGVLRRQVPLWLKMAELRTMVAAFSPANVGHGGEGALYVQLRRPR
jgi:DNA-nicking Smr family endonuclease